MISSRTACQRMQSEHFDEMEQILRNMDTLGADADQWSQENERFHDAICEWAGTVLVKSLIDKVLDQ